MSSLTASEKRVIERLLGMGGGYVLDFSNRTFAELVRDAVDLDIYDSKYDYASGSKANRLRAFCTSEPDHVVGRLLAALLDYYGELRADSSPDLPAAKAIASRLLSAAAVADAAALVPNADGRDFETLAKAVQDSLEKSEFASGLDRLHTFVVKYIRVLCGKHGIPVDRSKPLHSLFGEYVKRLQRDGRIESEMAARILKSAISTLESFNDVRNDRSLAHDNALLTQSESLLIFNHVAACIRFIRDLEASTPRSDEPDDADLVPF